MKKFTLSILTLLSLLATSGFAASGVSAKNEVNAPSYASGFGFGLAAYTTPDNSSVSGAYQQGQCTDIPVTPQNI